MYTDKAISEEGGKKSLPLPFEKERLTHNTHNFKLMLYVKYMFVFYLNILQHHSHFL